jgi:hypothetical protein
MTQLTSTWLRPGGNQLTAVQLHRTSRHRRPSPQLHLQIRKQWIHMTHCTHQEQHWTQWHTLPAPPPTTSGEAKCPFPSGVSPTHSPPTPIWATEVGCPAPSLFGRLQGYFEFLFLAFELLLRGRLQGWSGYCICSCEHQTGYRGQWRD